MMKMKSYNIIGLMLIAAVMISFGSCSKNSDTPPAPQGNNEGEQNGGSPNQGGQKEFDYRIDTATDILSWKISETLDSVVVRNLPADPATRDLKDGHVINETHRYTFFRFSDSTIVLYDSTAAPRTDSASQKWDIAFQETNIILNSGVHGPGEVEGQARSSTFEEIMEAPKTGYQKDQETGNVFSSWYNYNPQNHVISPKPGYMMIIHTNDDKYVKMEIIGYYKGRPKHPSIEADQRYYTFRYIIQQDGSRNFTK